MIELASLTRKILKRHADPRTGALELTLLGYVDPILASANLSRYVFAALSH